MSMVLELRRVSPEQTAALIADPSEVYWFLTGLESRRAGPGFFARLLGAKPEAHEPRQWVAPPEAAVTGLDKAWHCIHFLLTGDADGGAPPAGYLMVGGHQLGDVDVGYGPARALTPSEAGDFADLIASIGKADFEERYDPAELRASDIYPNIWDRDDGEFDYMWSYFEQLQGFMRRTKAAGEGIIIHLS